MKYICKRTNEYLEIDGRLHKPVWGNAVEVSLRDNSTGKAPPRDTFVRLMWNDRFLYAGFRCQYETINATLTEFNDKLYNEDVVEIFIDDDRDKKTYIEIEINPLNAVLHYSIHNNPGRRIVAFARTEQVIQSAVIIDEINKTFFVEIAIPFTEFATAGSIPPNPYDTWLFNLYRIDREVNGPIRYSALSPTGQDNFHMPSAFIEIEFGI